MKVGGSKDPRHILDYIYTPPSFTLLSPLSNGVTSRVPFFLHLLGGLRNVSQRGQIFYFLMLKERMEVGSLQGLGV